MGHLNCPVAIDPFSVHGSSVFGGSVSSRELTSPWSWDGDKFRSPAHELEGSSLYEASHLKYRFKSLSDITPQRPYTCECRSECRSLQGGDPTAGTSRFDINIDLLAAWNSE